MSQYNFGDLESPVSGSALINTHLEPWRTALHSCHSGVSRPSYAIAGMIWLDTTTTPWILKMFDGTDDISLGTVNATTNLYSPAAPGAGTITATMLATPASLNNAGTVGGTANAITLTPTPALAAYAAGDMRSFLPASTNTSGTVTAAVSGLATRNIKKSIGGALVILAVGDLVINVPALIRDDGTQYVLLNPQTFTQAADIASATTTNFDTATGGYGHVTGTTTITGITLAQGRQFIAVFDGILTLTNGASLILPGGANIVTAAGDVAILRGEASGVVRAVAFLKKNGKAIIGPAEADITFTDIATNDASASFHGFLKKLSGNAYEFMAGDGTWSIPNVIPQNSKSAAYTTVLADAGKHIFHPSADTTARVFTIDSNANVPYPVGTTLTFVNQNAGGVITIAITANTMRLAGPGTTGSRSLAANGIAVALKVTTTEWLISGTGLT